MKTIPLLVCLASLGFGLLAVAGTVSSQPKAEEIVSLRRIAMLFDGGSIQFRFELSSGSSLELRLNDRKQMDGLLRGVPEGFANDWWVWVVQKEVTSFLEPDGFENRSILGLLTRFLERGSDIDPRARKELEELVSILKNRTRPKVSYDFWKGFKNDSGK
jgi:hypothetical protein